MVLRLNPIRLWHRVLAWLGLHSKVANGLTVIACLLVVVLAALTVWLHVDDSTKIASDRSAARASQAASAAASKAISNAIDPVICELVYVYLHPVSGTAETGRTDQVGQVWAAVGSLVGCPMGVQPHR